ncbi:putative 40S ribosomal protein S9, mitochondrial [Amylocarpus encephaloides]|uniref:Small ribosomal subunit protein uS9m n=1 Tax=Amylocarpus encephaloides TaxID=45428 RepID=A0A9P7YHF0_9HELO|nr:putative 40S ribosomal protein S9, mitochondrial [Amylocarpus encephaloides]
MGASWLPASLRNTLQCACSPRPMALNRLRIFNTRTRHFSTSPSSRASFAAPEISFGRQREVPQGGRDQAGFQPVDEEERPKFYARLVPSSPSYFTAQPLFTDDLLVLQNLLRRYSTLPVVKPGEQPRMSWRSLTEYRDQVGEAVKSSKYQKIVQILNRLNYIHPSLMPPEVRAAINEYKRDINAFQNIAKVSPVDRLGRTLGAGRRKAATARAWVVEGTGEVLVNGKTLAEAFGRVHDRESVVWALKSTGRIDKYNVWALSMGGGTTGQAEALTLAVGKALMAHEPALKPALRRAGCLTRNPKRVERKKPGHVKARKMPAWVKR